MSLDITSITAFANNRGDFCFVRMTGVSQGYAEDIASLDKQLAGECAYIRLTAFEQLADRKQIEDYQSKAEQFAQSVPEFSKVIEDYRRSTSVVNPSIENNMKVSLMFWYDKYLKAAEDTGRRKKLVCSGKIGYREYLLCCLAYYRGFDVMLLLPAGDLGISPVLLKLSLKCTLGESRHFDIPGYRPIVKIPDSQPAIQAASSNTPNRTVVKIPPHRSAAKAPESAKTPANDMGRTSVRIPPRPSSAKAVPTQGAAATSSRGAIKIPPHPNRKSVNPVPPVNPVPRTAPQPGRTQNSVPNRPYPPAKPEKQKQELSYEQLAALAESVVMIAVCDPEGKILGSGSGIVISSQGYILTNYHVVKGGGPFLVRIENSDEAYPATQVIKYHTDFDMAILRIDCKLKPLPVYNGSKELVRGQKVVAIGSPMGMFNSVSDGIIAGFRKVDEMEMIQFTAATSKGSSGGALLNIYGEVIGISSAGIADAQNINLAVSYKQILPFIKPFLSTF